MATHVTAEPKPLRFVASYAGPAAQKAQRASTACRTCRKRKTKCDGQRPACAACKENGQRCLGYTEGGRRRPPHANQVTSKGNDEGRGYERHPPMPPAKRVSLQPPRDMQSPSTTDDSSGFNGHATDMHPVDAEDRFEVYGGRASNASEDLSPKTALGGRPQISPDRSFAIPYFRYFGPTAIVPGFKQMVVQVKEHRNSADSAGPAASFQTSKDVGMPPSQTKIDSLSAIESAVYDIKDQSPVSPLVVHLVETFFTHLGCNFPFLHRDRFMALLYAKKLEATLVDAVCALAARFSTHPLLVESYSIKKRGSSEVLKYLRPMHGNIFAQRARSSIVSAFPCPTLASIQACLLLAYEGFGANQDSTLWMFLGCAIRMTQDLGLQKIQGVTRHDQTSSQERNPRMSTSPNVSSTIGTMTNHDISSSVPSIADSTSSQSTSPNAASYNDKSPSQTAFEEERIDTFWAVLILDRVISSGTGRPVTLRDKHIELPFPAQVRDPESGWSDPFPALIRILHLYGRVSDLLNDIRDAKDITHHTRRSLDRLENDLTSIYQRLDSKLTFNVVNFQHYVEVGQGANFVLVHFWFHTLIIILHQPTLLHSYEESVQELLPNSRELSMSSAKTIADILSFAELVDANSFISNPFTSQPIYVAACAFLHETAAQTASQPASRPVTPPRRPNDEGTITSTSSSSNESRSDRRRTRKHGLLASAAKENYQRCYQALEKLETYWAGIKYILTALDQKAEGIWDPEIYTTEEMENAKLQGPRQSPSIGQLSISHRSQGQTILESPSIPALDAGQMWTLNGNTNSRNANLTFLYPNTAIESQARINPVNNFLPERIQETNAQSQMQPLSYSAMNPSQVGFNQGQQGGGIMPENYPSYSSFYDFSQNPGQTLALSAPVPDNAENPYRGVVGDMIIESQDISMNPFEGEMIPWLEDMPQDLMYL